MIIVKIKDIVHSVSNRISFVITDQRDLERLKSISKNRGLVISAEYNDDSIHVEPNQSPDWLPREIIFEDL
jgi:hypothetical protein